MRLLHTSRLTIESFNDDKNLPPYAILSHTWESEEVSFQDMEKLDDREDIERKLGFSLVFSHAWKSEEGTSQEMQKLNDRGAIEKKSGFSKIRNSCSQARSDSLDFIWIDTCCIDKTSSAELSEAINSMFRYYQNAKICYVLLSDAEGTQQIYCEDDFEKVPRWYSRGWTLQELIAPRKVQFFNKLWQSVGFKHNNTQAISKISGIDEYVLVGNDITHISVARRMAWCAERKTTRIEDMAYCMLGIFNINMPMLYGEGRTALKRLQEEIARSIEDQSLFAWYQMGRDGWGLLAGTPGSFEKSASVRMFMRERE